MAGLLMRLCLLVGLAQPKNMRHRVFTFLKGPWEIIIRFYNYELSIRRNGIGKKKLTHLYFMLLWIVGQESFVKVNNLLNQKHVQTAV